MSRFYVRPECVREGRIVVEGAEVRHITRVMRLGTGDGVVCFDGTGKEYSGIIESVKPKEVRVKIEETRNADTRGAVEIVLAQALPKKDKMDYIVQKCTELGVSAIVPMITSRTVVELDGQRRAGRTARWRKIAVEAAKQCGRTELPRIEEPAEMAAVLPKIRPGGRALIACLAGDTVSVKEALGVEKPERIVFLIGPEGGFTPEEIGSARAAGCVPVTLGRLVLRSDTAAVAVLAVLRDRMDE